MKRILTGAAAMRREDRLQQREDRLSDRVLDLRAQIAAKDARIAELEESQDFQNAVTAYWCYAPLHAGFKLR